jgi:hypothetical protein
MKMVVTPDALGRHRLGTLTTGCKVAGVLVTVERGSGVGAAWRAWTVFVGMLDVGW